MEITKSVIIKIIKLTCVRHGDWNSKYDEISVIYCLDYLCMVSRNVTSVNVTMNRRT